MLGQMMSRIGLGEVLVIHRNSDIHDLISELIMYYLYSYISGCCFAPPKSVIYIGNCYFLLIFSLIFNRKSRLTNLPTYRVSSMSQINRIEKVAIVGVSHIVPHFSASS